jgi:hypothetical protein
MSDAPLRASTNLLPGERAGKFCRLEPDDLPEPVFERGWWAIDIEYLAAYVKMDGGAATEDLRYEQLRWAIKAQAAAGNLLLGPDKEDRWPVVFPDGTEGLMFVVNHWNDTDLRETQAAIEYDDWNGARERPYNRDLGRWAGSRRHDEFGRVRTGLAQHFHP